MRYRQPRWPKIVVGTLAVGLVFVFFASPFWHPMKEEYFNYVAASCSEHHGLDRIYWQKVLTFDVGVEVFAAQDEKDLATIECIDRWAGMIMTNHVSNEIAHPTIQFEVRGAHYAPPERLISYHLTRPAD